MIKACLYIVFAVARKVIYLLISLLMLRHVAVPPGSASTVICSPQCRLRAGRGHKRIGFSQSLAARYLTEIQNKYMEGRGSATRK